MTASTNQPKIAFYVFGIVELQDMFPFIMEAKKTNKCWICYFDCFPIKRQFYHYSDNELISLFKGVDSNVYRTNDRQKYVLDYNNQNPDVVFIKTIKPKAYHWFPRADNSRIVYFNYMLESHHLTNSFLKVDVTLIHDEKWSPLYKKYKTINEGDYRLENLNFIKEENYKKRCFIIESWIRGKHLKKDVIQKEIKFYDNLIKFLRKKNYEIVWKKREKGYPKENRWASPLDFCNEKPDLVIEKDLMLPSSLFYYGYNSDICLFINDCFAFFDTVKINPNSFIIKSPIYPLRKYKFDEGWFDEYESSIFSYEEFIKKESFIEKVNKEKYNESVVNKIMKSLF